LMTRSYPPGFMPRPADVARLIVSFLVEGYTITLLSR
jgi:hypothetical protein